MRKPTIIIGAAMLAGLVVMIVVIRLLLPSATSQNAALDPRGGDPGAGWTDQGDPGWSPSTGGPVKSASAMTEADRLARLKEYQNAAIVRLGPGSGAAGGGAASAAPRYPSNPLGVGKAIVGVTPALRQCYELSGGAYRELPADVHVRVTIGPDPNDPTRGIVTRAETAELAAQQPSVEGCLQRAVSDLAFEPVTVPFQASLPLVLARRN